MADQNFREIQLSGKQLVFLFMTAVVIAVGVFLLGVSVGRGVRSNVGLPAGTAVDRTAEVVPPENLPPPTELTAADQAYHERLRGETTPSPEVMAAPEPPPDPPATDADVVDEPAPAPASAQPAPQPAAQPAPPPASTQKPTTPSSTTATRPEPAPQTAGWSVQVGAFRSRENADRQVQQLKAKGYAASVAPPAGGLYRVRVGPFSERAEADRAAARLTREEGLKPSVTR